MARRAYRSKASKATPGRLSLAVLTVLSLGATAPAAAATLAEELGALLADHPQVAADRASIQARGEGEREAFARFLPTLSVDGDAGWHWRIWSRQAGRHSRKRKTRTFTRAYRSST